MSSLFREIRVNFLCETRLASLCREVWVDYLFLRCTSADGSFSLGRAGKLYKIVDSVDNKSECLRMGRGSETDAK